MKNNDISAVSAAEGLPPKANGFRLSHKGTSLGLSPPISSGNFLEGTNRHEASSQIQT